MPRRMKKWELGSLYLKAQNCRFDIEALREIHHHQLKPLIIDDERAMKVWFDLSQFIWPLCEYLREVSEALRLSYNEAPGLPHAGFGKTILRPPRLRSGDPSPATEPSGENK